jgi:hypothetical protein
MIGFLSFRSANDDHSRHNLARLKGRVRTGSARNRGKPLGVFLAASLNVQVAIPIAIINPVASTTGEQTTEQLAATPEPAAPKVANGNCGNSDRATTQPWPVKSAYVHKADIPRCPTDVRFRG